MKCFYHSSDFDGHCSGAIVKRKYPECQMIGVEHDKTVTEVMKDETPFINNETVFIVDFCFDEKEMRDLQKYTTLIWIDHHKSSIEKMGNFECDGIRYLEESNATPSDKKAGCELTWEYLFPDKIMPRVVKLLGRYDIWDHEDPNVLPFQSGIRAGIDTLPNSLIWPHMFNEDVEGTATISRLIKKGETIFQYETRQNEIYAQGMAFETTFE